MAQQRPRRGHRITCEVKSVKGNCSWGHKAGDKFEVSAHDTAGMCGWLYHDAYPYILMLQHGGAFPWWTPQTPKVMDIECIDFNNLVRIRLTRED